MLNYHAVHGAESPAMRRVVEEILPLALVVALSPTNIIVALLLLFTKRPLASAGSFLAGFTTGIAAIIGGLVVLINLTDRHFGTSQGDGVSWFKLILGVALVILALFKYRSRPAKGHAAALPGWMSGITEFTPARALRTGAVVGALNPKNIAIAIAAALTVSAANLSVGGEVASVTIYVLVAILGVVAPIILTMILGDRASGILQGMRAWLERNNAAVMIVMYLAFGVILLVQGSGVL
jgi:Sap, sulfolipid-1-addressing protein